MDVDTTSLVPVSTTATTGGTVLKRSSPTSTYRRNVRDDGV